MLGNTENNAAIDEIRQNEQCLAIQVNKGIKWLVNSIFFIDDRVQDKEALFSAIDASAKWFVL